MAQSAPTMDMTLLVNAKAVTMEHVVNQFQPHVQTIHVKMVVNALLMEMIINVNVVSCISETIVNTVANRQEHTSMSLTMSHLDAQIVSVNSHVRMELELIMLDQLSVFAQAESVDGIRIK